MPSEVEFVRESHEYRLNGRVLISVTQTLKRVGYIKHREAGMFYANRGTAVHSATEFFDRGTLDLSDLDERLLPYLEQYRDFKEASGMEIDAIEERFAVEAKGYAGTRDRRVRFGDKKGVLDIKTGSPASWHPIQTAAYAEPLAVYDGSLGRTDADMRLVCRWALYLTGDGRAKLIEHTDPTDYLEWNAALVVAKGLRRRGIDE